MNDKKDYLIPFEQAVEMLPDGDTVHTFRNPPGMLIGADWDRDEIIDAIKKYGVEGAGDLAKSMNHGLVLNDGNGFIFIETKKVENDE